MRRKPAPPRSADPHNLINRFYTAPLLHLPNFCITLDSMITPATEARGAMALPGRAASLTAPFDLISNLVGIGIIIQVAVPGPA